MIDRAGNKSALCSDERLIELCQEAREDLEKAYKREPQELGKEVDFAEVRVVQLRDCLIDRIRSERAASGISRWQPVLGRVNMALSFIVGVEYPAMGIHRSLLEQALGILVQIQEITEQIQQQKDQT